MEETRRRTLHGRRRGKKLRAGQQSLLDTLLPRLALALPAEPIVTPDNEVAESTTKIDLARAFGGTLPTDGVWLEVGFGAGEHLVWQAEQHPNVGLIGCEPYINGVAKCLAHIERTGVSNVRLFTDDARAFHFFDVVVAVGDDPVARDQLHGLVAFVGERNRIDKEPLRGRAVGPFRIVLGSDLDPDVAGDGFGCGHGLSMMDEMGA